MKPKLLLQTPSRIAVRFGAFTCLLVATALAVWLRKATVALPLLVAATLTALTALNAFFKAVMLE